MELCSMRKLGSFFARRVLENICSEILFQQGFELLNDTPKKRVIGKIVRAMSVTAEQVESAFQQVRAQKATNTS